MLNSMNDKIHNTLRSWRYARLWKPVTVCMIVFIALAGSIQAAHTDYSQEAKQVSSVVQPIAAEPQPSYEWVHSGRTLFIITTNSGETIFAGIQAVMRVPLNMKTGRLYSIPVYFTRFTPQLCAASELKTIPTDSNQDICWNQDHAVSIQAQKRIPLDVFIGVGAGSHSSWSWSSSRSAAESRRHGVTIDIAINGGRPWNYHIPLRVISTYAQDTNVQPVVCGLTQQVWMSTPSYHYLSDIPTNTWDGPYIIKVKIDPVYTYPADAEYLEIDQETPPEPPVVEEEQEDIDDTTESLPIEEQLVESPPDCSAPFVSAEETPSSTDVSPSLMQAGLKSVKSVDITTVDNKPIYKVKGVKNAKLLGIISVDMDVTLQIDIDTGEIQAIQEPWWGFLVS